MEALRDIWDGLGAVQQDLLVLLALLAPAALVGAVVVGRYRVGTLTGALLWRYRWTNLLFALLMALSVGLGIALIAQERALRQGTARAADKFDVIVAAPGDRVQMLLSAVYLQPTDAPLLGGEVLARLQSDERIDLLAPIAFGDSYEGVPVVGTTAAFVAHLSGPLAEGRTFERLGEGVAGALAPVEVGRAFTPVHGHGAHPDDAEAHEGAEIAVVGRMAATGSPWDRAILVPVETVWDVHGLAIGHAPPHSAEAEQDGDGDRSPGPDDARAPGHGHGDAQGHGEGEVRIGPPFDPAYFPGSPAFLLHSDEIWKNYSVQAAYADGATMAFFPGAELARLHGLLGDVREMMSLMAVLTKVLVAAGVLAGLVALAKLFARRFALLRALGAPRRFVFAIVWSYAAALIAAGCLLGLAVGWAAAWAVSGIVTARTDVLVEPALGLVEMHLVAAFFSLTTLLALLPAAGAYGRDVVSDLRQS